MTGRPRITIELSEEGGATGVVETSVNDAGRALLTKESAALSKEGDHFHFFAPERGAMDEPLSSRPCTHGAATAGHLKAIFRPDERDHEFFPHLFDTEAAKKMKMIGTIVFVFMLPACAFDPAPRKFDRDPSLGDLPFSSAVVVGDTIYLSGEIGRAPGSTTVVPGGVAAETRRIFENYKATLARVGASLGDIVKCTVFLDDMGDYAEMNAAYKEFFPGDKPARSTFGVDGLALGAALEIECLAVKR